MYKFIFIVHTNNMENILEKNNKNNLIFNFWNISLFFIVYSFAGYLLETTFGLFTKGVLESRQSFLFGPFCAIYGVGAILMVTLLSRFKDKPVLLFFSSCIVGTIAEYSMSYFCEKIYHFKWWDYSDYFLNINGRVCLFFTVLWGILGILLIRHINPYLMKKINQLRSSIGEIPYKTILVGFILFITFDAMLTSYALQSFYSKIAVDFDLDLDSSNYPTINYVDSPLFSPKSMVMTYPNMQIAGTKYDGTYIDYLYDDHPTYYVKVFGKK